MRTFLSRISSIGACLGGILLCGLVACSPEARDSSSPAVPFHTLDMNVNETQRINVNGQDTEVRLVSVVERRDSLRNAVREARVTVEIDGAKLTLISATYNLPVTLGHVQIDCPVTKGYTTNSSQGNAWGLAKDARLRVWPGDSSWLTPGTFVYPIKERWFAGYSQMANEPTYVDGGEDPANKSIYYHYGLDRGGAEGLVEVVAAAGGTVVSAGDSVLQGYDGDPVQPRYDVVYLLDNRGWYYRYSHLQSIDPAITPGAAVAMGQKVGMLGKEGGSGGWSHLHFDITSMQPSGAWGIQEAYAFTWEAYVREYHPDVIAVARPHQLLYAGSQAELDASKSWSASGAITHYDWTFTDGTTASGARTMRTYPKSGEYCEVLKVTDAMGHVDYDFAIVLVVDKAFPTQLPPTVHPAFYPTQDIHVGDTVTFKVRSFRTTAGSETWNFGDGTPAVTVHSDGNVDIHAKDGYAVTWHRYERPGDYLVRVEHSNERGQLAIGYLHVPVEP